LPQVPFLSVDATVQVTARKEVVLSGGAFGTPHILLNSGIGDKSELDKVGVKTIHHLPDVGKGLVDHVMVIAVWGMNGTAPQYDQDAALKQWMKDRTGPMSEWYQTGKQILWSRLPQNSPLLAQHGDPASGPLAPHIELPLGFVGSTNLHPIYHLSDYGQQSSLSRMPMLDWSSCLHLTHVSRSPALKVPFSNLGDPTQAEP
jgi:hypothetical protein